MAKYEEKFIVINKKHLKTLADVNPKEIENFINAYLKIAPFLPAHKYYVCNQDEPYSQKVIEIILAGEDAKAHQQ